MLGTHKSWTAAVRRAPARLAAHMGLRPNHLTVASVLLAGLAFWFLATRAFYVGLALAVAAACLDFVDGELARLTSRVSLRGGYLDSLLDRVVDFLLILGVLIALDDTVTWIVGCVALFGSLVTSFAKARVFQDRHPDPAVWQRDLAERPERLVVLLLAILGQAVSDSMGQEWPVLLGGLAIVAFLSVFTILQRAATAWRVLEE